MGYGCPPSGNTIANGATSRNVLASAYGDASRSSITLATTSTIAVAYGTYAVVVFSASLESRTIRGHTPAAGGNSSSAGTKCD